MASRRLVPASVREALLGIPSDIASLERNYLLADDDLDLIGTRRRPENRLGLALHIALLLHPGQGWHDDTEPPAPLVAWLAAQMLELETTLTDAAIALFERLTGRLFTRSRNSQDRSWSASKTQAGRLIRLFGGRPRVPLRGVPSWTTSSSTASTSSTAVSCEAKGLAYKFARFWALPWMPRRRDGARH